MSKWLNDKTTAIASEVWGAYDVEGITFFNARQETTPAEIDQLRRQFIPELQECLNKYFNDSLSLDEFKTTVDSFNKRNPYWGFKGINGQMYFNVLAKASYQHHKHPEVDRLLKKVLKIPGDISQGKLFLQELKDFTRVLESRYDDRRSAPKAGSIPYFLSYFWQMQQADKFPVYYTSMVNTLSDLEIWTPTRDVVMDYVTFYELNLELKDLFSQISVRPLHFWDVEHAFWYHDKEKQESTAPVIRTAGGKADPEKKVSATIAQNLPESYIPPVVSMLPLLAENDENLAHLCQQAGTAIEKVFEDRIAILFQMLGYEVDPLGQGRGRVPDGVAISHEYRYAIIYDAKVRKDGYTMGIDERAIREYILHSGDRLNRQGYRKIYFMIISSKFNGEHDSVIRNLKIETDIGEILLVEAAALLEMLEAKLRNPNISLGSNGIQNLFAASGLLTAKDVKEFLG